jgi:hypothetical protein
MTPSGEASMVTFELFIKGLDKALDLLKLRSEKNHKVFREVIDPLYKRLEIVVADYHQIWSRLNQQTIELSENPRMDPRIEKAMRAEIGQLLEKMVVERRIVYAVAARLVERDDVALKAFGQKVIDLFEFAVKTSGHLRYGLGTYTEGRLVTDCEDELALRLQVIARAHGRTKRLWLELSELYAELQLRNAGT